MSQFYHYLRKKSILIAVLLFLFVLVLPVESVSVKDPYYNSQNAIWQQIGLHDAWNHTVGSQQIVVAIIDTGIDKTHPDLINNIWINKKEIQNNFIDDDNNGFIDDINGWNFIDDNNNIELLNVDNNLDKESITHGTIIAGLIGAEGRNGYAGTGVNWKVSLMPLRVIDNYGEGCYGDISDAIDYAVDNGAHIISMSFVGDRIDDNLYDSLRNAYESGVLIVVAAGNKQKNGLGDLSENPLYPICFDNDDSENWLLGVSSVDSSNHLSSFANFGRCVDLVAPGSMIFSTQYRDIGFSSFGGPWQGTSFSAPLVAGSAALLKSLHPEWGANDLIKSLLSSANNLDKNNLEFEGKMGYGLLNIGKAINQSINIIQKPILQPNNLVIIPPKDNRRIFNFDIPQFNKIFNNFCYTKKTRIYCYDRINKKEIYLTDINRQIISYDWLYDGSTVSVLSKDKNIYTVTILNGKGIELRSWELDVGFEFDKIKFVINKDLNRVFISGYDIKNKLTKIIRYNLEDLSMTSIKIPLKIGSWSVLNNDGLFLASIVKGRLSVLEVDSNGNKKYSWLGPNTTVIESMDSGHFWSKEENQLAIIIRNGNQVMQFIVDLSSSSFYRTSFSNVKNIPWYMLTGDVNQNGLDDIFRYNLHGLESSTVTGKDKGLKSVYLPNLIND